MKTTKFVTLVAAVGIGMSGAIVSTTTMPVAHAATKASRMLPAMPNIKTMPGASLNSLHSAKKQEQKELVDAITYFRGEARLNVVNLTKLIEDPNTSDVYKDMYRKILVNNQKTLVRLDAVLAENKGDVAAIEAELKVRNTKAPVKVVAPAVKATFNAPTRVARSTKAVNYTMTVKSGTKAYVNAPVTVTQVVGRTKTVKSAKTNRRGQVLVPLKRNVKGINTVTVTVKNPKTAKAVATSKFKVSIV